MQNWLTKQVSLNPERVALTVANQSWTFKELQAAVLKIAGQLATLTATTNQRIAILAKNTAASYMTIMAVQQLGIQPVLLNFRLANDELHRQLQDAGVTTLLIDDELADKIPNWMALPVDMHLLSTVQAAAVSPIEVVADFSDTAVASIMYTSGTTGNPHGVLQTYQNHFYSAIGSALNLGLQATDRWLCAVPLFHISGLSIMMRSLIYGMGVDLVARFDDVAVTKRLIEQPIAIMSVVPTMLKRLLAVAPITGYNAKFRCFLLGGGPIDPATLTQCEQQNIAVIQSYGMTETASQIVALNFDDARAKIGSVGKPLFPVQIRLANPEQGIGEIELQAPNLTAGYLNQAADFARKITADGWYKTGDLGFIDDDGFLFIKGRQDDMFISGGENIFPDEVEHAYSQYPGIQAIAVVGKADSDWGMIPVAFVISDQVLDTQALQQFGRMHLAHYKVPVEFRSIAEFPTTASGKVQRHKLRELF
ncbi:o-succinylbenzoate--CoA ligase [Periweissella ghanensis]|uniref:2-succinylbenzoate--CoA ligase n=1 Tax=Periweissella ghanensis TaxID=467997 RepID=A0ABM8ZBT8_9LACO|nr:o-succinylbenzoate--CoA ligase [Periweissella ghanensis]MCM0601679.1 o-succinylbenzoate--CoA ligase [Periweissella ghanensis]CAH0418758.1 2-succinylbenzoate--CoA ligase [Periweissella ghanensis]